MTSDLCLMILANWHRNSQGILQRGVLKTTDDCPCRFDIYEPIDLLQCPYILIVTRNPHTHPLPERTKTPATIARIFNTLLLALGWRLADATPRRLLLDHRFVRDLREILDWRDARDPGLGDLHPSLANFDHAARLINKLRYEEYPEGTGLQGKHFLIDFNT